MVGVLDSGIYRRNRLASTASRCGRLQLETTEEYSAKQ
jgi:hypothetical protein